MGFSNSIFCMFVETNAPHVGSTWTLLQCKLECMPARVCKRQRAKNGFGRKIHKSTTGTRKYFSIFTRFIFGGYSSNSLTKRLVIIHVSHRKIARVDFCNNSPSSSSSGLKTVSVSDRPQFRQKVNFSTNSTPNSWTHAQPKAGTSVNHVDIFISFQI